MTRIDLEENLVCQVHALLHEEAGPLARLIEESRQALAAGPVSWQATVTPRNVHCVESLLLLAKSLGCRVHLDPAAELDDRERAFLDDIREHFEPAVADSSDRASVSGLRFCAQRARACLQVLLRMLPAALRRRRGITGQRFRHVTLIGSFGGEHLGDIATLGGVLLRMQRQFGVREACLFSYSAAYTRRLAAHLDTPVALAVQPADPALLRHELQATEALVWAGGPIMDLPPLLVRQLAAIYSARRRGRPVLLEGVAIGPLQRATSRWAARRITGAASRISVTSSAAAADPLLQGIEVGSGEDPAFDYLATRGELTRLADPDRQAIEALLQGSGGHILVGINLRQVPQARDGADATYTRFMEERLLQHLAVAVTDYARLAPAPVTYVFFPMNLKQDGGSDLAVAWRLNRMLHKELDLRVWQADPDIDTVLYLLRRMDMVLAMRFHACVFAMSQAVPTIGIDYSTGVGGRVEQLFRDRRRVEDIRRLDEVDIYFMVERLLMNQPGGNTHPELYP